MSGWSVETFVRICPPLPSSPPSLQPPSTKSFGRSIDEKSSNVGKKYAKKYDAKKDDKHDGPSISGDDSISNAIAHKIKPVVMPDGDHWDVLELTAPLTMHTASPAIGSLHDLSLTEAGKSNPVSVQTFGFNKVFGLSSTQAEVFDVVAKQKLDELFEGVNCTIFAYGESRPPDKPLHDRSRCSIQDHFSLLQEAVTYDVLYDDGESEMQVTKNLIRLRSVDPAVVTSTNTNIKYRIGDKIEGCRRGVWFPGKIFRANERGMVPRCIGYIFKQMRKRKGVFKCRVSYVEMYSSTSKATSEKAYDLLDADKKELPFEEWTPLQIFDKHNKNGDNSLLLRHLEEKEVKSEEEALNLYYMGTSIRLATSTEDSKKVSRSNSIFKIVVEGDILTEEDQTICISGTLSLVDLAGSGKLNKVKSVVKSSNSSSSYNNPLMQENVVASNNLSLHYLEQIVITLQNLSLKGDGEILDKNKKGIPYRNSLLTYILRDSLGGNCKCIFLLNISIDPSRFDETLRTCSLGQRCGDIKLRKIHANTEIVNDKTNIMDIMFDKVSRVILSMKACEFFIVSTLDRGGKLVIGPQPYCRDIDELISLSAPTTSGDKIINNDDDNGFNDEGKHGNSHALHISRYNMKVIQMLFDSLHSIDVIRSRVLITEWLANERLSQHFIENMDKRVCIIYHSTDDSYELVITNAPENDENSKSNNSYIEKKKTKNNINIYDDDGDDDDDSESGNKNQISLKLFIGDFVRLQSSDENYWKIKVIDDSNGGMLKLAPCDDNFNEICFTQGENEDDDDSGCHANSFDEDIDFDIVIEASQLVGAYILPGDAIRRPNRRKKHFEDESNCFEAENSINYDSDYDSEDVEAGGAKAYRIPPISSADAAFDLICSIFQYYQDMLYQKIQMPLAAAKSNSIPSNQDSDSHGATMKPVKSAHLHHCEKMANTLSWVQRKSEISKTTRLLKQWRDRVYAIATSPSTSFSNNNKNNNSSNIGISAKCAEMITNELRSIISSTDVLYPLCYILRAIFRGGECGELKIVQSEVNRPGSFPDTKSILFTTIYDLIDKSLLQKTWKCIRPSTNCDREEVRKIRALIKQRRLNREASSDDAFDSSDIEWEALVSKSLNRAYLAFFEPKRSILQYYDYLVGDVHQNSSSTSAPYSSSNARDRSNDRVQKVPSVIFKCDKRSSSDSSLNRGARQTSKKDIEGGNSPMPFLGDKWICQEYGGASITAHIQQGDVIHLKNQQLVLKPYNHNHNHRGGSSGGNVSALNMGDSSTSLPSTHWFYVCKIDLILMAIVVYPIVDQSSSGRNNVHSDRLFYVSVCDLWSIPVYRLFLKSSSAAAPPCPGYAGERLNHNSNDLNDTVEYNQDDYDKKFCSSADTCCLTIDFKSGLCSIDSAKVASLAPGVSVSCLVFLTPIMNFDQSIFYLANLLDYVSGTLTFCLECSDYYRVGSNSESVTNPTNKIRNADSKRGESSGSSIRNSKSNSNSIRGSKNTNADKNTDNDNIENQRMNNSKTKKINVLEKPKPDEAFSSSSRVGISGSFTDGIITFNGFEVNVTDISTDSFGIMCSKKICATVENLRPSLRRGEDLYKLYISPLAIDNSSSNSDCAPGASSHTGISDLKQKSRTQSSVSGSKHGFSNKYNASSRNQSTEGRTVIFEGKSLSGKSFLVNKLLPGTSYTLSLCYYKQIAPLIRGKLQKVNGSSDPKVKLENVLISRHVWELSTLSNTHICESQILRSERLSSSRALLWVNHKLMDTATNKVCLMIEEDPNIRKIVETRVVVRRRSLDGGKKSWCGNDKEIHEPWLRDPKSYSINAPICLCIDLPQAELGYECCIQIRSAIQWHQKAGFVAPCQSIWSMTEYISI